MGGISCSHKRQVYSRAYINFKKPEDVIDFYEDFNGHVFVNERGVTVSLWPDFMFTRAIVDVSKQ